MKHKPLLSFQNVERWFGKKPALVDVTFDVLPGTITALLGPNGAGKSTTLQVAMNLIAPSKGSARILGVDSRKLAPIQLQQIGYVAEGMAMPDWMTVGQFINWCRPLYPTWDRKFEDKMWKQFELPKRQRIRDLSRGERMKAALMSSLAYRPKLILLDEPFSGLDPIMRDEFIDGLLELADGEEWSAVISSHDIAEVSRLCDRMVTMHLGKVWLDENIDSLLARHRRVEVLLPEGTEKIPKLPQQWLSPELTGRVLRFIDTTFDEATFRDELQRFLPGVETPDLSPMSLREIFISLIRGRKRKIEVAPKGGRAA
jgi:ABC-2 type transport system ATP-binding protein